ncbi:MAG: oligosaccharide flippase family protein [Actinobacteria bacterium]|nr:oligosaccharide flippase family protein [Actinomycetota bacterium]
MNQEENWPGADRASAPDALANRLIPLLARNARVLAAAGLVAKLATVAVAVVLAQGLGEREFGRYVVAVAFASLLGVVVEFGTGGYLVREAAQKPHLLGRTTGLVLLLRSALGLAAVAVAISLPPLFGYERTTSIAIVLFTAAAALRAIGATFLSALQALERLGDVAAVQAQQAVVGACAAASAIALGGGLITVSWVAVGVAAASVPWSWWRLNAARHGPIEFRVGGVRDALPVVASFSSVALFSTAITYLDSLLVHAFKGDDQTGLYGAAYMVLFALYFIPTVYSTALIRSMSQLASTKSDTLAWLHSRVVCHLTVAALPLALFGLVGSRALLDLLYGEPYGDADLALTLLLASLVFTFPGWIAAATAYAVGAERRIVAIVAASLALNITANLLAIPLWGIEGAAAANLATEALAAVLLLALVWREGVKLDWIAAVGKPLLAIAPSVLIVVVLAGAPLAVPLAIGAVVYVAGLLLLRTFDAHDYDFLRAVVGLGRSDSPQEL